jgi:hypothetical protein
MFECFAYKRVFDIVNVPNKLCFVAKSFRCSLGYLFAVDENIETLVRMENLKYRAIIFLRIPNEFRMPPLIFSKNIIVPYHDSWYNGKISARRTQRVSNLAALRSSVIALSRPLLSMVPPVYSFDWSSK